MNSPTIKWLVTILLLPLSSLAQVSELIDWQIAEQPITFYPFSEYGSVDITYIEKTGDRFIIALDYNEGYYDFIDDYVTVLNNSILVLSAEGEVLAEKDYRVETYFNFNDNTKLTKLDGRVFMGTTIGHTEYDVGWDTYYYDNYDLNYTTLTNSLNIINEYPIGGDDDDWLEEIQPAGNEDLWLIASSASLPSGDKTSELFGYTDIWLVKIDSTGNVLSDWSYGGSGYEWGNNVLNMDNGDLLISGVSTSGVSGNKTSENKGDYDYWLIRTDSLGNILWDKSYGGTGDDQLWRTKYDPNRNSVLLYGYSNSGISGDKTEASYGLYDIWIVEVDLDGNIIRQKSFGGSQNEQVGDIHLMDNGYYISCQSNSPASLIKHEDSDLYDIWELRVDSNFNILWEETIGSLSNDYFGASFFNAEHNILAAEAYRSPSKDKTVTDPDSYSYGLLFEPWVIHRAQCPDGDFSVWYQDWDGDGYGSLLVNTFSCDSVPGYISIGMDCNDGDSLINPEASELCSGIDENCNGILDDGFPMDTFYLDWDGDGYGLTDVWLEACVSPAYYYVLSPGDCDDGNNTINPGIVEVCDSIDNDCNGIVDDGLLFQTLYLDEDGDGYGNPSLSYYGCNLPMGYVPETDCNDDDPAINPSATETCNGIDDDCDGVLDNGFPLITYYFDGDGDGYGVDFLTIEACTAPPGYTEVSGDCNDSYDYINPGAPEICNYSDDDCNGIINDGLPEYIIYQDADGDGYGHPGFALIKCEVPDGFVLNNLDCDDDNAAVHPFSAEVCNYIDDNCNGSIDEGLPILTWYPDDDGDGYGVDTGVIVNCEPSMPWFALDNGDCDDSDPDIHPGATEISGDGIDNDCDGETDELGLGIEGTGNDQELVIYPNPASKLINVQLPDHATYRYTVLDSRGNTTIRSTFTGPLATVDLQQLPAGSYILKVEGLEQVPFIKE